MSKVKIHTIDQPESDITTFVLSCNRLPVLDKTLQSFWKTSDYKTKMVIVDDSAEPGVFETLVEKYGDQCDVICFPRNRSQWWAMDFMVSYCDSEYIFYLEDDWELLQPGYLKTSKEILEKHRDIGTVDISWRTFEWQGIDSYDKTLIDDMFYYKKPWRISDYHLHWYGWVGSPNLKRRDDLILLGRVEKWHNEWNIDRKFLALGFKAVFLNGEYARHLGDDCSRMDGRRPDDSTTPEHYYPEELQKDRIWPKFDYFFLDTHLEHPYNITLVSAIVDLERSDRDFKAHYLENVKKILDSRHPLIIYSDPKYFDDLKAIRGDRPMTLKPLTFHDIAQVPGYSKIQQIIFHPDWYTQSSWMENSVIRHPLYIPLTLIKQRLLQDSINDTNSKYFYWVDSGIYGSFNIPDDFNSYYFTKLNRDQFFISTFPYYTDTEIHGYNINSMTQLCKIKPDRVCRATLFGGNKEQITKVTELFYELVEFSANHGLIGTEESIYTILSYQYPELFYMHPMPNGDILNLLRTMR